MPRMAPVDWATSLPLALALVACAPCHRRGGPPAPARPAATASATVSAAAVERAAATITAEGLHRDVAALSADAMGGRGPGSAGDGLTRRWLAAALDAAGYRPGGSGGGWEQPFELVGVHSRPPAAWRFAGRGNELSLEGGADFVAVSGVARERVAVQDAELVFAGYGITAPEERWDDFAGTDVRGKVLLVLNDDPSSDPAHFGGARRLYYGRWTYKYESAARHGAAGAIIIHTDVSAGYPWQVVQTSWSGEQFMLPTSAEPRLPLQAWVTEAAARRLVALAGRDLGDLVARAQRADFSPIPLGITTSATVPSSVRSTRTANVLGLLEGSDPKLRDQVVVLSAHHDHLGTGDPKDGGDRIYNGARDNGAGMAQALAVARALAAVSTRPRRSVLVAFVGAEEQGLLGSRHYAAHPTFPRRQIAADLNFELGNIWGPARDVIVHGKGKSTLEALLERAAAAQGRWVHDEPDPRAGWYYRSDQLSFARIGVPALWFESGRELVGHPPSWGAERARAWVKQHYHQPSDELGPDWRFDGMVLDAQLAFAVALAVAQADERPAWLAGDEFARKR